MEGQPNKFDLGEEVYYIKKVHEKVPNAPCDKCESAGYFLTKSNKQIECNECHGSGKHSEYQSFWDVSDDKLSIIGIYFENEEDGEVVYSLFDCNDDFDEETLFLSKDVAKFECANRNKVQ